MPAVSCHQHLSELSYTPQADLKHVKMALMAVMDSIHKHLEYDVNGKLSEPPRRSGPVGVLNIHRQSLHEERSRAVNYPAINVRPTINTTTEGITIINGIITCIR